MKKKTRISKRKSIENLQGVLFTLPVIIGIAVFTYYQAAQSLYYSFFDYNGFSKMDFVGFKNFVNIFTHDKETLVVFGNTFLYAVITVPLGLVLGYLTALLVNNKLKGINIFRALFYLPVVIPAVAAGVLWRDIFNSDYGVMNQIIGVFGLHSRFFEVASSSMPTLIFTTVWGVGGSMVIWLSAFKNIPVELYESAKLDGANAWHRLRYITLPMSTPMIFFNLVTAVIGSLQTMSTMVIMGGGAGSAGKGESNSLYFIVVKIYNDAFGRGGRMGYASAFGWILFIIIGLLTFVLFKSNKWVQYAENN
ncbi:sugar ABC transporter permease [Clostridia bacterium]|nr:sugar ABC transporter permease [Clostridia bacterium]